MRTIAWLCLCVCVVACTPRPSTRLATAADWEVVGEPVPAAELSRRSEPGRRGTERYVPDTNHLGFWPIKYVRLNVHVMDKRSRPSNLDTVEGPAHVQSIVNACNHHLARVARMNLPVGGAPDPVPSRMRYVLTSDGSTPGDDGVYFHYDEEVPWHLHTGRRNNIGNSAAFNRYKYRQDSTLNVFFVAPDPDSVKSETYRIVNGGVAFGASYVKLSARWDRWDGQWAYHQTFTHEISHIYTLAHTWAQDDGCDDTPRHKQCWNYNLGCDEISNNLMDYTAAAITLTPCQVGRMQAVMAREGSQQRKYLQPNWCRGREGGDVVLRDTFVLRHEADLEGNLTIAEGGYLEVRCRLSMPAGKRILVQPGGTLKVAGGRIHNSCGLEWAGIEVGRRGKRFGKLLWGAGSLLQNTPNDMVPPTKAAGDAP